MTEHTVIPERWQPTDPNPTWDQWDSFGYSWDESDALRLSFDDSDHWFGPTVDVTVAAPAGQVTLHATVPLVWRIARVTLRVGGLTFGATAPRVRAVRQTFVSVPVGTLSVGPGLASRSGQRQAQVSLPPAAITLGAVAPAVRIAYFAGTAQIAIPPGVLNILPSMPSVVASRQAHVIFDAGRLQLGATLPVVYQRQPVQVGVPAAAVQVLASPPQVFAARVARVRVPAGVIQLAATQPQVVVPQPPPAVRIALPAGATSVTGAAPAVLAQRQAAVAVAAGSVKVGAVRPSRLAQQQAVVGVVAGALSFTASTATVNTVQRGVAQPSAGVLVFAATPPTLFTVTSPLVAAPAGGLVYAATAPRVSAHDLASLRVGRTVVVATQGRSWRAPGRDLHQPVPDRRVVVPVGQRGLVFHVPARSTERKVPT